MAMLMDWFCKRQGITELKPQDLEGPAFELVKVFHPNVIHLQYQMDECHKLLTDSMDESIIKHNVSKPLPLGVGSIVSPDGSTMTSIEDANSFFATHTTSNNLISAGLQTMGYLGLYEQPCLEIQEERLDPYDIGVVQWEIRVVPAGIGDTAHGEVKRGVLVLFWCLQVYRKGCRRRDEFWWENKVVYCVVCCKFQGLAILVLQVNLERKMSSKGTKPALSISKMKPAYYPDVVLEKMVSDQMWIEEECKYDIAAMYGISHWWFQRQRFYIDRYTSEGDCRAVRTHMWILSVVRIEFFSMYGSPEPSTTQRQEDSYYHSQLMNQTLGYQTMHRRLPAGD
nr:hypothetical protein [Tanacetum cinerariifolium]